MIRTLGLCLLIVLATLVCEPRSLFAADDVMDSYGNVVISHPTREDIPRLLELLASGDSSVYTGTGRALVELAPDSLEPLYMELEAGRNVGRVLETLLEIGDAGSPDKIAVLLNGTDDMVSSHAHEVLVKFGNMAVPALVSRFDDAAYLEPAVKTLGGIEPDGESVDLVRMRLSGGENARAGALAVLGKWKDAQSEYEMADEIANGSGKLRYYALVGYGELHRGNRSAYDVPVIMMALSDPDEKIRREAARILGMADVGRFKDDLLSVAATDESAGVRGDVLVALEDDVDGGDVMRLLEMATKETDPLAQANLVYMIGTLKATEAVPELLALLDGPNGSDYILQREIFLALQEIGKEVDLAAFGKYLGTGDPHHNSTVELLDLMESQARPGDEALAEVLEEYIGREDYAPNRDRAKGILDRIRK